MKLKNSILDTLLYICLCILSLGLICLFRVVISEAIRCAFKEEGK